MQPVQVKKEQTLVPKVEHITPKKAVTPPPKPAIIMKKPPMHVKKVKLPKKQVVQKKIDITGLLALQKELKQRKPDFVRPESWRYVRIHEPWRKPKGIDHKVRLSVKGWPPLVKVGFRGPKVVRGLHPSGLRDVLVHNSNDMERLNPRTDAVRFAATLGGRTRAMLMQKAQQMGIRVLNPGTVKVSS